MKKRRKKYPAFLLTLALAIGTAGCTATGSHTKDNAANNLSEAPRSGSTDSKGKAEDTSVSAEDAAGAKGRYTETQIDTPQGFSGEGCIQRLADKSLALLDVEQCTASISEDNGKTWDTKTIRGLEDIRGTEGIAEVSSMALSQDGDVFIAYLGLNGEGTLPGQYLYFSIYHPEDAVQKFELNTRNVEYLHACAFTRDGRLFAISTLQNVYEVDLEKKSCRQVFTLEGAKDAALCSNEYFLIASDGTKVYFYDLESKKTEDEDQVLNAYIARQREKSFGLALCAAKNGKDNQMLYVAGCNGIAGHVIGGSVMEQLVDGALSSLGDPSKTPRDIIQDEDGSFLVLFADGELDVYVYDKDASAVPQKQLVIYGLYDNETVRQAVSVFRKKNPEVFVRFEAGLSDGNGMTKNDAVKNLNTALLAKEGPDLILLDDMPLESYQEKGMLADLSGLADELTRSGDYFAGILNGFQSAAGTYALPFRYQVPLLAGDSGVLSGIADLKTLADAVEKLAGQPAAQETVAGCYTPEEVLEKFYLICANAWISENGEVDPAALQEFLAQAKRIYQADQKNLDEAEAGKHREYVQHIQTSYKDNEKKAAKVLFSISRISKQLSGCQLLTAGYLATMFDFQMVTSVKKELGKQNEPMEFQLLDGQDANLFCPTGTVGISVNSRNQELAEEFIRVLLSHDVQKREFEDGFPVNADAYEAFTTDPTPEKGMAMGEEDKEGNEIILGVRWPDGQELERLKNMLYTLDTPAVLDDSLKNEVVTIGAHALKGDRTIEDSAEEIAQKISLYLNE